MDTQFTWTLRSSGSRSATLSAGSHWLPPSLHPLATLAAPLPMLPEEAGPPPPCSLPLLSAKAPLPLPPSSPLLLSPLAATVPCQQSPVFPSFVWCLLPAATAPPAGCHLSTGSVPANCCQLPPLPAPADRCQVPPSTTPPSPYQLPPGTAALACCQPLPATPSQQPAATLSCSSNTIPHHTIAPTHLPIHLPPASPPVPSCLLLTLGSSRRLIVPQGATRPLV